MLSSLLLCLAALCIRAEAGPDASMILQRMQAAWSRVVDYRAEVEVKTYKGGGSFDTRKFVYTFKKPDRIRLDLEQPHPGMVLVFPDKEGKVFVKPSGVAGLFRFHLKPDSRLLKGLSGQRIDQTDLGQLVRDISHDLTDLRYGPAEITEAGGFTVIRVLAADHFLPDTATLYAYFIDEATWLPARVEESTPEGRPKRSILFRDLCLNIGVPDNLFRTD